MLKLITMIAGPNGAGKSTLASKLVPPGGQIYDEFVDADLIAQGLAPLHPESVSLNAGKLMMRRFHELLAADRPFAFETTGAAISIVDNALILDNSADEAECIIAEKSSSESLKIYDEFIWNKILKVAHGQEI